MNEQKKRTANYRSHVNRFCGESIDELEKRFKEES